MKQLQTIKLLIAICFSCVAVSAQTSAVNVRLVDDEADNDAARKHNSNSREPLVLWSDSLIIP